MGNSKALFRLSIEEINQETRAEFWAMGGSGKNYTRDQKIFALKMALEKGVRATERVLLVPRRTLQRWQKKSTIKAFPRYPSWVREWADRRRERREFWQRKGYS